MIEGYPTATVTVTHLPLDDERRISEGVTTGSVQLTSVHGMGVGVWEHSAGHSRDIEVNEVFVVLSGRGRVRSDDGGVMELAPGVVGVLHAGTSTTWEIDEPLRKVWLIPDPSRGLPSNGPD